MVGGLELSSLTVEVVVVVGESFVRKALQEPALMEFILCSHVLSEGHEQITPWTQPLDSTLPTLVRNV
jgi:hypothetical protein